MRKEVLDEVNNIIEDIFYTASLLRSAGDHAAAKRFGDLGDKFHDEYMRISKEARPS